MDLFTYLMAKNDHNTSVNKDLFSYLLGKGQSGTYQTFTGTSISANNTKKAKMKLDPKGNTSQTGTPTPDSPQPINVVSGDNEVVVNGINIWDEEWEQGYIQYDQSASNWGQNVSSTNQIRSKNYIPIDMAKTYYGYIDNSSFIAIMYDENKQPISNGATGFVNISNRVLTLKPNTKYIRFYTIAAYGGTYLNDICINVSDASINGTYYPYQSQTYNINLPVENLFSYSGTQVNLVKNTNRTISIYPLNTPLTLQAGTYTFSLEDLVLKNNSYPFNVQLVGLENSGNELTNKSRTITISEEKTLSHLYFFINGSDNDNATATFSKIQLEKGSKANSYTPYGTTPIELCKIGTYQDYFTKNSGKNLLPFTNQDFTINGVRYYAQNGGLILNGTSSGETYFSNELFKSNFSFTLQAGTYTLNKNIVGNRNASYFHFGVYKYSDNTKIARVNDTTPIETFTLSEETNVYVGFYVYQQTFSNEKFNLQLNEGSTPLPYEPYGTGLWCKYNAIGKIASYNGETITTSYISTTGGLDTGATVYYVLDSPYLSLIEDETLISQLDNIQNAMSYKGQTNISQVNNDLPFEMEAEIKVSS